MFNLIIAENNNTFEALFKKQFAEGGVAAVLCRIVQ